MILTRMYLNARRASARKLLGSPHAMHAAVLSGFPPGAEQGRVLWRVDDEDPVRPALYIVSRSRPDVTHIEEQGGWATLPTAVSRPYQPFLDSLAPGQIWGFRLTANPTHRARVGEKSKILAHVTVSQQEKWLWDRQEACGFSLGSPQAPTAHVVGRQLRRFSRNGSTVTLGMATFQGALTVTDANVLRQALTEGIGRAKGYGCGLLTLAPLAKE